MPEAMEELYVANRSGLVANMLATEETFFQDELARMFWTHCHKSKRDELTGAGTSKSHSGSFLKSQTSLTKLLLTLLTPSNPTKPN